MLAFTKDSIKMIELAKKHIKSVYYRGESLNDLVPLYGTYMINEVCNEEEERAKCRN
jgi:hypothetical protein